MKTMAIISTLYFSMIAGCSTHHLQNNPDGATTDQPGDTGIKILSYNIHHANPPSKAGIIDIPAIAEVIKKQAPDLVAIQEVDVHTDRSGKALHEAEELGKLTGLKAYFSKSIDYGGGEYGLAILSRFPVESVERYELPTAEGTKGEPRILMTATIVLEGDRKIIFACTHLDAQKTDTNRLLQIKKIKEIIGRQKFPVIIAGDFNAEPSSETVSIMDSFLQRSCSDNCPFTIPQDHPRKTIDYIAVTPSAAFAIRKHAVIQETYASDHRPVFAVINVK